MSRVARRMIILHTFVFSIIGVLLSGNRAGAASSDELYLRALHNSMMNCYSSTEMASETKIGGTNGYLSFEGSLLLRGKKTSAFYIPTSFGPGNDLDEQSEGTKIGCYELFLGDKKGSGTYGGKMTGLFDLDGKVVPSASSTSLKTFLTNMGYVATGTTSGTKKSCLTAQYTNTNISGNAPIQIGKICWSDELLGGNGQWSIDDFLTGYELTNYDSFITMEPSMRNGSYGLGITFAMAKTDNIWTDIRWCTTHSGGDIFGATANLTIEPIAGAEICSIGPYINWSDGTNDNLLVFGATYSEEDTGDLTEIYRMPLMQGSDVPSYGDAYHAARQYLAGSPDMVEFTDADKYQIYKTYLTEVYGIELSNNSQCTNEKPTEAHGADENGDYYYVLTSSGYCRVAVDTRKISPTVSGFTADEKYRMNTYYSFLDLLQAMLDLDVDPSDEGLIDFTPVEEDPSQGAETEPSCASRAGELGWILCPLIKGAGDLLQGFFESWIEPFLQIDAELLGGSGNGVFEAWQGFQGIANLAFIAIFLFVIFSQLTGIGIDNYGIKKVLPKLIIGAILINLSYIICQLAVDISNIVGHAMKGFFGSLPPNVGGVQIRVNGGEGTGALEAGALVLTAIVGALVVQKVLTMGIMVIIPILIMVLTLLFSLFFLFFMLGLRQALAIVLVTISPLAFVCYILPNTKSLFKRWTDLFKGMLLAYPIASALVYGGDLVSRILINANAAAGTPGVVESLGLLVTAAIVSIAPVFAIPGLLKKSLSAVNGVGNMLGRVQSGGRNGANRVGTGLQNSRVGNHMQNWQNSRNKAREDNRNLRRAGLQRNADGSIELSRRGRAQDARAQRLGNSNRGRAYRQRLAAARNEAYGSYNSDMSAARIATDAGAMATLAGLTNKQQQQEIQDEILNMAKETGNYDLTTMERRFADLVSTDPSQLSSEDQLLMKALATKMSETGFGAKSVAKILSGGYSYKDNNGATVRVQSNQATRRQLADYMTSTDVANKVGSKDMYVAQYLRDIAAGNADARDASGNYITDASGNRVTMTFDQWAVDDSVRTGKDANGNEVRVSNVEHVAKKILDDDELLAKQGGDSLERTIAVDTGDYTSVSVDENNRHIITTVGSRSAGLAVSKERAQKIIDNENIHTKEEQEIVLSRRSNDSRYSNGQSTP